MCEAEDDQALDGFLPPVASWFRETLGSPTLPQCMGWPSIAAGRNTLIVAPTGSGKTLAAFLQALDFLWRTPRRQPGVRILYVSPLKALNEDIRKNLEIPLAGILDRSVELGRPLEPLTMAVRSGDTPARDRARVLRKPPDILITTPESLHLMLTSRAREILRSVSHVIVDEIHAVCGNKRGVFLALLLERLEAACPASFVRIGLSATQRPLDEVARYLGGQRPVGEHASGRRFEPRPVNIIDAGRRKSMDLQVLWPGPEDGRLTGPPGSIWPAIRERISSLAAEHRSTIVFTNSRRVVEKLTAQLNETIEAQLGQHEQDGDATEDQLESPQGAESNGWFRAHHGSLSLEERQATEQELKSGMLKGVVSTASLELGIDMGDVDLVCQVESPGNVARGLQRVGRAGHVVHGVSKGRLIAKTPSDLLETAALARAMVKGEIETLRVPRGCLDVLAQQVVACVAMDRWTVPELFDLVRRAYPYADLPAEAFESVLCMISGRFSTGTIRDLRARISWDRIHNRLAPLPGSAHLALVGGGTIPDTGQYPVMLGEDGPRLGELDEEFVLERRVGETFALGNSTWRIDAIEPHKVVVRPAEGTNAVMPFWRGEQANRSPELGEDVGELSAEIVARSDDPGLHPWLASECRLEASAAGALVRHVMRQQRLAGVVPDHRTILVETFRDPAGELGLAVLSPWGGRLHQALKIALLGRIRQQYGLQASCLHGDDGLLIRLPRVEAPPLDLLDGLSADEAERLIRLELPETALFGLRFRQNAARALLMPRPDPAKRTPLWLQRLRAKDLLQVVGKLPDFPILVETFRECLEQDLEIPRLRRLLDEVAAGAVRIVKREGELASPFASDLIFQFTPTYLYEWDEPRRGDLRPGGPAVDEDLLEALLEAPDPQRLLDPQAVGRVEARLRRKGLSPRTVEEMAQLLLALGDLTTSELSGPMADLLRGLEAEGRACHILLPGVPEPDRWISAEESERYARAFPATGAPDELAMETVVNRYLHTHALIGLAEVTRRYPIDSVDAGELLERWVEAGRLVRLEPEEEDLGVRWVERENLAEIRRISLAIQRREGVAVPPEVFADFLARRQLLHPAARLEGQPALEPVLEVLTGYAAAPSVWEGEILPRRIRGYRSAWLDELLAGGQWTWRAHRDEREEPRTALLPRDFAGEWHRGVPRAAPDLTEDARSTLAVLNARGASFATDLARATGLDPSRVRLALSDLMLQGLTTNDRFDPVRPGGDEMLRSLVDASARVGQRGGPSLRGRPARARSARPEGRWTSIESTPAGETHLLAWIDALLGRYGVLSRDLVEMDPWAPSWADLMPLLARAELRGELRRGYFVEGLSGVQYAEGQVVKELTDLWSRPGGDQGDLLIAACDPANLYGGGAPLDIPILDGGTARLSRIPGNYLVLRGGRPVLVIESGGRRLTGLPSAPHAEIESALDRLLELARSRAQVLKVETYNGEPAIGSLIAPALARLGFVRDYPGMTYYAAWDQYQTRKDDSSTANVP